MISGDKMDRWKVLIGSKALGYVSLTSHVVCIQISNPTNVTQSKL